MLTDRLRQKESISASFSGYNSTSAWHPVELLAHPAFGGLAVVCAFTIT